jgi:hypothetical protein
LSDLDLTDDEPIVENPTYVLEHEDCV